ncbi:hypothetical protein SAMN05421670_0517 [Psychrobacillus psychrotolerans]|uniref:Uncharacterized protein n=1 Tax=Psychrobacillus psychrotolerans TaxID=126156 RepID=A0A1I5URU0_9BACI|nr:hypothetical protein [Psychrobacillus psychrotolerans]SFP97993.1 hypothetical protein SAMN05421670_0517 [Psychrobacillus psychrotolerans]
MFKKNIQAVIWAFIVIVLVMIWLLPRGDDKEQIAGEINNHWNVANINHIEVIDDNKSVAFSQTVDGNEMEVYLEKSLFSWEKKSDYSFNPEGITEPIHLSFFSSPFSNEEEFNAVLLRVFDKEIDSVQIVKGDDTIHNFKLLTKDSGKKFALFRTKSDELFDAEYIAYNSEGEVVYMKPAQ